jgi:hypothetical protein
MKVWRGEGRFLDLLKADAGVRPLLSDEELGELFDIGHHLKHVDTIFAGCSGLTRDLCWCLLVCAEPGRDVDAAQRRERIRRRPISRTRPKTEWEAAP